MTLTASISSDALFDSFFTSAVDGWLNCWLMFCETIDVGGGDEDEDAFEEVED